MSGKPLTFLIYFNTAIAPLKDVRLQLWNDYAAAGAKHIVLSDELLRLFSGFGKYVPEIRAEVEAAGLKFLDAHAPFGPWDNYCLPDEAARPAMIARQKLALQLCADFDVHTITAHVGGRPLIFAEYTVEQIVECTIRTLDELLPVAEKLDVTIGIENSTNPLSSPEQLLAIVRHFNSPHLGICYDAGHANQMARPIDDPEAPVVKTFANHGIDSPQWDDQILEKMLPEVVICHLHDNDGIVDQHRLPGLGNVDWRRIMPLLLEKASRLQCIQDEAYPHSCGYFSAAENVRIFTDLVNGIFPQPIVTDPGR